MKVVFKMMDFVLKMMDFEQRDCFPAYGGDFMFQMMSFVFKMMNSALKMMNLH